MLLDDPHFRPIDREARWQRLADELRAYPEGFSIALENLDRWEQWGRTHRAPILAWRAKIAEARSSPAAMDSFLAWLADDNEDSEPLKGCSPFVGLISAKKP